MTNLWLVLSLTYLASTGIALALAFHALSKWRVCYYRREPLSSLNRWHHAVAGQWFHQGIPRAAPSNDEALAMVGFALSPLLNTILVATQLLGATCSGAKSGMGALAFGSLAKMQQWRNAQWRGRHQAS